MAETETQSTETNDYSLSYTGEEVNSAIAKADKLIFGKVRLTENSKGALITTYTVNVDLSAYTDPICVACIQGAVAANYGIEVLIKDSYVQFYVGTSGMNPQTSLYIGYIIADIGN
jgi:hypothetical protein